MWKHYSHCENLRSMITSTGKFREAWISDELNSYQYIQQDYDKKKILKDDERKTGNFKAC